MIPSLLMEIENVIVETESLRRRALLGSVSRFDVPPPDDPLLARCTRLPTYSAVRAILESAGHQDETLTDLVTIEAERLFATGLEHGAMLRVGARELMDEARVRTRLAAVTRARRHEADRLLALAGFGDAFAFVIAAEDAASKPSAAPYEAALARLGRSGGSREGATALEDGEAGCEAARRAGIRCIVLGARGQNVAAGEETREAGLVEIMETLFDRERNESA